VPTAVGSVVGSSVGTATGDAVTTDDGEGVGVSRLGKAHAVITPTRRIGMARRAVPTRLG
jgi:hypothetical protein